MKQKLEEQKPIIEDLVKQIQNQNKQPLLHQRIPGTESEMSAFSK